MNDLYDSFANKKLGLGSLSDVDTDTDDIIVILCRSADYTANLAADTVVNDIPSIAQVSRVTLASPVISAGRVNFSDVTFPLVPAGDPCDIIIVAKDTGSDATSPLMLYLDTFPAGMPVTPTGSNIDGVMNVAGLLGFK